MGSAAAQRNHATLAAGGIAANVKVLEDAAGVTVGAIRRSR
ncbi:hypothetical protein [Mycolicibacter sinensis]|jgi:hypothetical protein|nr:hypothetical protein [Mycolicibacter sinensis]